MLYRGFSYVHARLLLKLQAEIEGLETELDALDQHQLAAGEETRLRSWVMDAAACEAEKREGNRTRDDVLEDLRIKVCQYDELLIKARELMAFQRPSVLHYNNVRSWHEKVTPLASGEQNSLQWKDDLLSLRHGRDIAGLDVLIERILCMLECRLMRVSLQASLSFVPADTEQWLFGPHDQKAMASKKDFRYFSSSVVTYVANISITTVILALLFATPVIWREVSEPDTAEKALTGICILIASTVLFAGSMSLLTNARRHELFAASAAYCALLQILLNGL